MKRVGYCKRLLEDSRDITLAAKSFVERILRIKSGSSISGAVLYKKNVLEVLRGSTTMDLSQDLFFSSRVVPRPVEHPVATLHRQDGQRRARKRLMMSAWRDMWTASEGGDLPRSFPGLAQIYLEMMATSSKFNAFAAYPARVVRLKFSEKRRRYSIAHGHTLLRFLPVGAAELGEGDKEQDVD